MKDALAMYHRQGADVDEIYSQTRIAQEASVHTSAGQQLRPGWSLDLMRLDPQTGGPWDLGSKKVQQSAEDGAAGSPSGAHRLPALHAILNVAEPIQGEA